MRKVLNYDAARYKADVILLRAQAPLYELCASTGTICRNGNCSSWQCANTVASTCRQGTYSVFAASIPAALVVGAVGLFVFGLSIVNTQEIEAAPVLSKLASKSKSVL